VKEQLHPARHRHTIAHGWPKTPLAGCLNDGAVEGRCRAVDDSHASHVPFLVDLDIRHDIAGSTGGSSFGWVCGLPLLQHLWWFDRGYFRLLSASHRLCREHSAESEQQKMAFEPSCAIATTERSTEWKHEISSIGPRMGDT
jgi:hypothetical protein